MSRDLSEVKGARLTESHGKNVRGRRDSKCQSPEEMGVDVRSWEASKEVHGIGTEGGRESGRGWDRE